MFNKVSFRILSALILTILISCGGTKKGEFVNRPDRASASSRSEFERAEKLYKSGKSEDALLIFQNLSSEPRSELSDRISYYIGEVKFDKKDYSRAFDAYDKVGSDAYPQNIGSLSSFKAALALFNLGRYKEAEVKISHVNRSHMQRLDLLFVDSIGFIIDKRAGKRSVKWALGLMDDYVSNAKFNPNPYDGFDIVSNEDAKVVVDKWMSSDSLSSTEILAVYDDSFNKGLAGGYYLINLAKARYREGFFEQARDDLIKFKQSYSKHELYPDAKRILDEVMARKGEGGIKIGVILPLSGKYAVYGESVLKGIECAAGVYEPCKKLAPVRLMVQDVKENIDSAVQAVEVLSKNSVSAIIGPLLSISESAVEERAKALKIPIMSLAQKGNSSASDCLFRNVVTAYDEVKAVIDYAFDKMGKRRFYVFYPDNKKGKEYVEEFSSYLSKKGGNLVGKISYPPEQVGMMDEFKKLFAQDSTGSLKESKDKLDAIFIPDSYWAVSRIASSLFVAGMEGVQLLGTSRWHNDRLTAEGSELVEGAIFPGVLYPTSDDEVTSSFLSEFKAAYNLDPTLLEGLGYDSASMIIKSSPLTDSVTPANVCKSLTNLKDFQGVTGTLSVGEDGRVVRKLKLLTVKNGRIEKL